MYRYLLNVYYMLSTEVKTLDIIAHLIYSNARKVDIFNSYCINKIL